MTQPVRTTDQSIASYRRFVNRTVVSALQDVFSGSYDRDRQGQNLNITMDYPLAEQDFPCIMVEYEGRLVSNAGVGHEEWFDDANGELQKWHHSRFEGDLNFNIFGLSSLDRDLWADAVIEVLRFGRLDAQLLKFFTDIYGDPNAPVELIFSQLMLNIDIIHEQGNNIGQAPWGAEDVLIYSTGLSIDCHGGYYNVVPPTVWGKVGSVNAQPYPQGEVAVDIPFGLAPQFTNPFDYYDDNEMPDPQNPDQPNRLRGAAVISGTEEFID